MISRRMSVNHHRTTLYPGPCHFVVVSAHQHKKVWLPQAYGWEEFASAGRDIPRLSYGQNYVFFFINVSFQTVRGKQMKQSLSASISLRYLCVLDPSISVWDNHWRFLTLLGSWSESLDSVGNPYNRYLNFLNRACQKHFLQYVWWKDPFLPF